MKGISDTPTSISRASSLSGPPIAAVFLLGVSSAHQWQGRADCHVSGFVVGILRIVLSFFRHSLTDSCMPLPIVHSSISASSSHILHCRISSQPFSPRNRPVQLNGLTYGTTVAADKAQSRAAGQSRPRALVGHRPRHRAHLRLLLTTRDRGLSA